MHQNDFTAFVAPFIGLPVSRLWRGQGSAIFLEFGQLRPRTRPDSSQYAGREGSSGAPSGEMGVMIEWSWRIEGRRAIICGSWGDERTWPRAFALLVGTKVTNIMEFGRLSEIELSFSNGARLLSFMTAEGDPRWVLFDRRAKPLRWLTFNTGKMAVGTD